MVCKRPSDALAGVMKVFCIEEAAQEPLSSALGQQGREAA